LTNRYGYDGVKTVPGNGQIPTANSTFPGDIIRKDPQDEYMTIKKNLVGAAPPGGGEAKAGIIPGIGLAIASDSDIDYLKRKSEAASDAEYNTWIMNQADFSTPEKSMYWDTMFPWINQAKLSVIERNAESQKTMARIQVTGPQSNQDWQFLYALKQGYFSLSNEPIYNPVKGVTSFKEGLFSLFSQKRMKLPNEINAKRVVWSNPISDTGNAFTGPTFIPPNITNYLPN